MADMIKKLEENVAGQFYVDSECIGCAMCTEIAPNCFKIDDAKGLAYVAKQPTTDEDKAKCTEAIGSCPVEAIGNDGE